MILSDCAVACLQAAAAASSSKELVAAAPLDPSYDKRSLCVDVLVEGNVNSFVDFFYLTHRPAEDTTHDIHVDQLPYVKEFLCTAEAAHRKGAFLYAHVRRAYV